MSYSLRVRSRRVLFVFTPGYDRNGLLASGTTHDRTSNVNYGSRYASFLIYKIVIISLTFYEQRKINILQYVEAKREIEMFAQE